MMEPTQPKDYPVDETGVHPRSLPSWLTVVALTACAAVLVWMFSGVGF